MLEDIKLSLSFLFEPDQLVELRALGRRKGEVRSGYFRNFEHMAGIAEELDKSGEFKGIYVVLNRISPSLYSRSPDTLYPAGSSLKTTGDQDIDRRRWLPVDFDPKRQSGVSSTDEEHGLSIEAAKEARETLTKMGWPDPVLGDSGNGAHLIYTIDLPNDEESRSLVEDCLRAIAELFGTERVDVDTKNFNAARIWKLYGTCARKGENEVGRPWRRSKLLEVPREIETVDKSLMLALARMYQHKRSSDRFVSRSPRRKIDLEKWLSAHGLDVVKIKAAREGGTIYVLETCPFDPSHNDRAAFATQWPSGDVYFKCHHNHCDGRTWRDLLRLYGEEDPDERSQWDIKDENSPAITLEDVTYESDKGTLRFSPKKASQVIVSRFRIITTVDKTIWIYQDGIYVPRGEDLIDQVLDQVAGDLYTISKSRETIKKVQLLTLRDDMVWNPDPFKFGVKNGVIDLQDGSIRPYSPEDYITLRSPLVFDPEAKCREIARFFKTSLGSDHDILTLIDIFVSISCTRAFPYFVSLIGPGSNGKKVLETIMQNYVGFDQVTHVRLDALDGNAFIRGELKDKRVLINTEVSGKKMESHWMKAISSGDRIESDRKNKTRIEFYPFCLIVIDTNDPPKFYDRSHGFNRRFVKLDFPYIFSDNPDPNDPLQKKADPYLEEKLINQEELSGLLNMVIKRAPDVIRTCKIHRGKAGEKLVEEYDMQSHHLSTFVDMFCELVEPGFGVTTPTIPTDVLYEGYEQFCRKINATPQVINLLGSTIHKRFGITSKTVTVGGANKKGFEGVILNGEALKKFMATYGTYSEDDSKKVAEIVKALLPYDEPPAGVIEEPVVEEVTELLIDKIRAEAEMGRPAEASSAEERTAVEPTLEEPPRPALYNCQRCGRETDQLIDFPGGSFCISCAGQLRLDEALRKNRTLDRAGLQKAVRAAAKLCDAEGRPIVPLKIAEEIGTDQIGTIAAILIYDGYQRTDETVDGKNIYRKSLDKNNQT